MNLTHAPQKATANDYISFRRKIDCAGSFRLSGKREIKLLVLHGLVKDGETQMAGSLRKALKDGGVGEFFRLKKEILVAIGTEQNQNVREIGELALHNAEQDVLSGPEFGGDTLKHAARLRDARVWE